MTYDEAVEQIMAMKLRDGAGKTVKSFTKKEAEFLLSEIGYREMQRRIKDWQQAASGWCKHWLRASDERDAARALADQLAGVFLNNTDPSPYALPGEHEALVSYEARGWK